MLTRRALLLAAAACLTAPAARADVKVHPLFTDNMVLQRDAEVPVWGKADPGEEVSVSFGTEAEGVAAPTVAADKEGNWRVKLPARKAGTGFALTVKGKNTVALKNVAVGDVWVCSGQSNMEWRFAYLRGGHDLAAKAVNKNVRLFTVPKHAAAEPQTGFANPGKGEDYQAKWLESDPESVFTFSAVGYYFGTHLQKSINVPVGLIHTSWGGTPAEAWTSSEGLGNNEELRYYLDALKKATAGGKVGPFTPTSLYNGMIHPLLPFAIKGAVWYQGESNAGKAAEYRELFPRMIEDWRHRWKAEFPFFAVQLAPYHAGDADGVAWAELREAQLLATKRLPKVGLAVITDVGELFDIHPQNKEPVGQRLAVAARGIAYGQKVEPSGPEFRDMKVEDGKAVLTFDHLGGGLVARGSNAGVLNGFTVCGEDRHFYPAKAVVKGDTVVVSCGKVPNPVAVRFGWKNFPVCNLFGKSGLPASPFRTDDFPLTTGPQGTPKTPTKR